MLMLTPLHGANLSSWWPPQSLLLQIAQGLLEAEAEQLAEEKEAFLSQNCPTLSLPTKMEELQVQLHSF